MKVLIAIDDSECSNPVFKSVCNNPWPVDTDFIVLTVVEPITFGYNDIELYYADAITQAQKEYVNRCRRFNAQKVEELKAQHNSGKVEGKILEGDPASLILDEAEGSNVDLIVLGSHGRKGFQKFLLGSVAEKVASHAKCSVYIVKSMKRDS